jgi:hypothetical protein
MVLTQVETLFAMRTTGPQDIAAIEAWIKYHQVGKTCSHAREPRGRRGLGVVAALPEDDERHQIRRRATFDSGATPKNVRAKDTRPPATLADIDLSAMQVADGRDDREGEGRRPARAPEADRSARLKRICASQRKRFATRPRPGSPSELARRRCSIQTASIASASGSSPATNGVPATPTSTASRRKGS